MQRCIQPMEGMNGLVLAGGYSTRMGRDKGLLCYHDRPQREHLFDLLGKYCEKVFTSCRRDQGVPENLNPLYDAAGTPGPLNGILTAFQKAKTAWLVVAVDMPFVDALALETLIAGRGSDTLASCFFNRERQSPEPLLAIWEPLAYPQLISFSKQGGSSPRKFLEHNHITLIQPHDERVLVNVNQPANGNRQMAIGK